MVSGGSYASRYRQVVSRDPGTCIDKQVTTDRAGICNLSLTHRGSAQPSPGLTELVYLLDDTGQVRGPVLLQHRERNG